MLSIREKLEKLKSAPISPERLKRQKENNRKFYSIVLYLLYCVIAPAIFAIWLKLSAPERKTVFMVCFIFIISVLSLFLYIVFPILTGRREHE